MSTLPDNEFDLEKLFLPAWAQGPSSAKTYENFKGEDAPSRRRDTPFGNRPPRRDRPPGGPGGPGAPQGFQGRGPDRRGDQGRGPQGRPGDRRGRDDRSQGRPQERRELPPPLPEINVALVPDEKGVESLARQIKITGRAYPLFDIAQMILQKPERHSATFSVIKNAEGQPVQPLFLCALDETLWLSEEEVIAHVLKKHFGTFYQAERTATEPPKGRYTFVAQCGMSGTIFGPPNHHDYQNQLRKLHSERFSRMPFEAYKSNVRIVRDEEVVKKWVEDQSWKTDYLCLNMPEPLRLPNLEAVEKHFRETHKETIIKKVDSYSLGGLAARNLRCAPLTRALRSVWEDQRRFPLQIATVLSQQFAGHGLQFFKVNKTLTHVSVARPHYLDLEATPVSEGVRKIVEFLNSHQKVTRRQLVDALAPAPALKPVIVPIKPVVPQQTPVPVEGETSPVADSAATQGVEAAPVEPAPATVPAQPEPSAEQNALVADLHWLIHQGHVIEFANGTIETAKKPLPKPPKPERKPAPADAAAAVTPAKTEETSAPAVTDPAVQPVSEASAESAPDGAGSPSTPVPESEPGSSTPITPTLAESAPEPASQSEPGLIETPPVPVVEQAERPANT